ncbi:MULTISPECIES: SDR family NAD(P)-dependent oxidoreductase [unclassified Variovorax]|jgi:NAD(P)-dependent dehydrogenase (short-subunit alcohol dehydrogenase family)|uniref:SDR family NAD(P)-dependent oxidoreductase n=1 Tax=unclassified Variovorax TaxID=663243 RepID=UPI0008CC6754|nr:MULTISPECIES: SDR family oxidoreductase [unclassified Variovorax]SEK12419.1 NAD(P)-dependent dehydrogenase, short-chain alcohol dehydrogenase family [Variovorax sp. OK202]SFD81540.1 NAD(P)-dependent dehydrogenase, short-chain alcohol dehydrogenase family [Variovorax sp. OK212]
MAVFDFSAGHRVLVVGGAGDIGAAISRAFLEMGCSVIATGVDEAALAASSLAPVQEISPELSLRTLDVTSDAQVAGFVGGLDRLDTLVNCAGILARFKEFEIETFQRVLDVNLTGTFRLCNASLPLLEKSKGSIVNVASMNAFVALPFIPAYCASKGGVVMLTKSLSLAWAERGVRVNAIAPGYVETAINAAGRQDQAHYERIRSRIPLGQWAQPGDIAGSAVFLASPAAHYVTGTVLAVDGGFLAG